MRLSVFGLDHGGAVLAGCLAGRGHEVIAVDQDAAKVELIRSRRAPVSEPRLDDLIKEAVASERLTATTDFAAAIADSVLSSICLGAPPLSCDDDVSAVASVCEQIGLALRGKDKFHSIALRIALPVGATRNVLIPAIERASGKSVGRGFGVAVYPSFLRRGRAVEDCGNPPAMLFGATDDETLARLREMDIALQAPEEVVDLAEAEAMTRVNARAAAGHAPGPRRFAAQPMVPRIAIGTIG